MRIAVFGATGYTGTNLTEEALRRGHSVVALSRHGGSPASQASGGPGQDVEVRTGSVFDADLVAVLATEVDALVVAVPAVTDSGNLIDAVPHLLDASTDARLGVVGGAGSLLVGPDGPAMYDTPTFPEAYRADAKAQGAVLAALRAGGSQGNWFYLSPPGTYGKGDPGERTGTYRLGKDVLVTDDAGVSYISGADYAIAFLDELENPKHPRTRFTVGY